jgi:hypothetical protein
MNSNQRKDATLGMPHGTANGKLKKIILFHLLKKHGENICFKCSKTIERAEELSIEHKKPWEGISAELYWDIENITFSHLRCNRPDRPSGGRDAIDVPEGTIWCGQCRSPRPISEFTLGAKNECSICKSRRNALRERKV